MQNKNNKNAPQESQRHLQVACSTHLQTPQSTFWLLLDAVLGNGKTNAFVGFSDIELIVRYTSDTLQDLASGKRVLSLKTSFTTESLGGSEGK